MKALLSIPFDTEPKKTGHSTQPCPYSLAFKKVDETAQTFTWWRKSEDMGKPGATPFFEGHSTFGGTGLLCPSYFLIINAYRNRQLRKTAFRIHTSYSVSSFTF